MWCGGVMRSGKRWDCGQDIGCGGRKENFSVMFRVSLGEFDGGVVSR